MIFEKKALVRMAALLHDIGHGCYSHVGEGENSIYPNLVDPINGETVSGHEAYTRCIIKERLSTIIESFWPRDKYQMVEAILQILSQSSSDPVFRFLMISSAASLIAIKWIIFCVTVIIVEWNMAFMISIS